MTYVNSATDDSMSMFKLEAKEGNVIIKLKPKKCYFTLPVIN